MNEIKSFPLRTLQSYSESELESKNARIGRNLVADKELKPREINQLSQPSGTGGWDRTS